MKQKKDQNVQNMDNMEKTLHKQHDHQLFGDELPLPA